MSDTFSKESDFEAALVKILRESFGWGDYPVLMHPTEQDIIDNWAQILYENNCSINRLDKYPLTKTEMRQILDKIDVLKTPMALNGFINGKSVSIIRDNKDDVAHYGKTVALSIFDRLEIAEGKSRYQIAEQPEFKTSPMTHDRRGDVMLLINGMPVIHIELKRSGVPVEQAAWQIRNYAHTGVFTGVFSLVQIFVAMNPDETVYFANPGPGKPFNEDWFFHWADFNNEPVNDWREVAHGLLSIPMAHQLIGFYTVADDTDGVLKVMRSYQYYAAREVTDRAAKVKWADNDIYGGYVWHTTGSGKTLTSFKCAQLIAESGHADKVVFLLNRIELGTQTLLEFKGFADDSTSVQGTESTSALVSKLKSDAGDCKLIVTSIQKMSRVKDDATSAADLKVIRSKRIVFIVDECHTDTFGEMLATIKQTFNKCVFFGFTGTPIFEENQKNGCSTVDIFGNELHRYLIVDGIRDKNVLAFDPYMEMTFSDVDVRRAVALEKSRAKDENDALADEEKKKIYLKWMSSAVPMEDVEAELPNSQYLLQQHREMVVKNIADNWVHQSVGGKFHAILATSSIPEAFAYYDLIKVKMPSLQTAVVVDDSIDNDGGGAAKEDALVEMLKDYNARYGKHFTLPTFADFKRDVARRLAHKKPYAGIESDPTQLIDMVIVVNQMLTGYDSKWVNTLYLDKMLKNEHLIQAFSRTNRIFGIDKPFGTIKYYRRPHTMRRNVEEAIATYSGNKPFGMFVSRLGANIECMNLLFANMKAIFARGGHPDMSALPEAKEEQALFASRFNEFCDVLCAARVQGFAWGVPQYNAEVGGRTKIVKVEFSEEDYLTLLRRYAELPVSSTGGSGGGSGGGGGNANPPFAIKPSIIEMGTGVIDANYINAKFKKFTKALHDGADLKQVLQELHQSFAMLSVEDQKYAQMLLDDIMSGKVIPEDGKTLTDYIAEYKESAKNDRIHRLAVAFGADEKKLRDLMSDNVTAATIDEFGRFTALLGSVDYAKAAAYFTAEEGVPVSVFQSHQKTDKLFRDFILCGGFDIRTAKWTPKIYRDEEVAENLRFVSFLPLYTLEAACGYFTGGKIVEREGWVKAEGIGKLDNTMVVVRAVGNSMEQMIHDGDLCVVRKLGAVDYDNRIVLVQRNDRAADPESGGAYLLKKYVKDNGHTVLRSLNGNYPDIQVRNDDDITVVAYLHKVLNRMGITSC